MPYTVKQVSALTGIAPDRLRAWERRYGVVSPARTESRYRLYDDDDLARLRMMMRLVEGGAPASLAAQQVREADDISAQGVGGEVALPVSPPGPPDSGAVPPREALVAPARSLERDEVEQVLDRAFASGSFESVVEHWLLPALSELGTAWADGRVDVAGEHFVSGAVRRRLGRAFDASGTALGGPVVLVGLPPGALHDLGSLSFATCLRRLGADVRWLGSDLPVDSWVHAATRLRPAAVVMSVPLEQDTAAAAAVWRRLHEAGAGLRVYAGGRGADGLAPALDTAAETTGSARTRPMDTQPTDPQDGATLTLLPHSVVEAARAVAAELRGV